jgi:hypothetical protein
VKENQSKSNRRGGHREGAGRKPGSQNKLTRKAKATLAELCQVHTEAMVRVLVDLPLDPKVSPAARATCAQAILDRGNGRPVQQLQTVANGGPAGWEALVPQVAQSRPERKRQQQLEAAIDPSGTAQIIKPH